MGARRGADAADRGEPRGLERVVLYVVLLSPGLLPVLCPYLPFQDWPAHAGVVGALVHADEPQARILEFYEYVGWFKMNALFYLPAVALAWVVPPLWAVNGVLAASLAALGPATAALCRAAGADPRLALLAVPLAIGRHVYCGFGPNAAALAVMMLAFAAAFALLERPTLRRWGALLLALFALAFTHAFIFLAAAGLMLLVVIASLFGARRRAGVALTGALVAAGGWFAFLFTRGLGVAGRASQGSAVDAIWGAIWSQGRDRLPQTFWEWLFASYRYSTVDDAVQAAWVVAFSLLVLAGAGAGRSTVPRWTRRVLWVVVGVTVFMFWLLPSNVGPPVNWWGARLRLPPVAALLMVPLAGSVFVARHAFARWALFAIAVAAVGLASWDLARFDRTYMGGFSEVLDAVPPGQRLAFLHHTPRPVNEYPGVPFGYFANYYLLQKGGAIGADFFQRSEYPFLRKTTVPGPSWSYAAAFRWAAHGPGADGFLVRLPSATYAGVYPPGLRGKVAEVTRRGAWAYYRPRESSSPPPDSGR